MHVNRPVIAFTGDDHETHISRPRDLDRRGRRSGVVEPRPSAHDDGARRGADGEVDVGQAEALQARVGCSA